MDKINVYNLEGQIKTSLDLPQIFNVAPRLDLIRFACEVSTSKNKQIQGRDKRAGLRNTAKGWGTGHGMSRAPRIQGSGFSTARNVGRVPFAKGGRATHAIKVEKKIEKKINNKTKKLSLISAISASGNQKLVKQRGHLIEEIPEIPLVIDDKVQTVKKTREIYEILCGLGLSKELRKIKNTKKVRPGKGKRRGRKYKIRKGPLFVIKDDFGIVKASKNLLGMDISKVEDLSVELLAPGALPGRFIIWTQSAFSELNKYEDLI
ncbi:MAG: 50S ribosomal protein L4 [Candidatus Lokiarchaeota archaeon]|nr:50S ribosomal protein L4 [Candidatus Lokiarchaeota archaeon]